MTTIQYPAPNDRTYYLSGPISGDIVGNEKKFLHAVTELRARGYSVVSPVEVCTEHIELLDLQRSQVDWIWYMRRDIEALVHDEVQGIIMLPGWEFSKGACLELQVAKGLNYYITTLGECLVRPVKVNLENADRRAADAGLVGGPDGSSGEGAHSAPEGTPSTQEVRDAAGDVGLALGSHEDRPRLVTGGDQLVGGGDGGGRDPR